MKKIFITALLFSLVGWAATLQADDQATYTITGTKDKRLDAWYSATYVSQNLEDEACSHYARHKGFRRPKIASRGIGIEDVNYTIKLPITLAEDENNCNYRFSGLMLIMRRMNDEKLSSIHYILSDQKEVRPVYWKTERGESYDPHPDTPPSLVTDKKYFRIKEWAGDKYVNGIYADTTPQPDILLVFSFKQKTTEFSVECKWRQKLYKNGVEFAKKEQFDRYKNFEKKQKYPVFIAIGIGGKAILPEQLYVVPLQEIDNNFIHIKELKKYEKKVNSNFFFNIETKELK